MADAHSKYSASGFEAATLCPGKRVMELGKPDTSSKYADEGTAAHSVLQMALDRGVPAITFRGDRIPVGKITVEVTEEMCTAVQTAIHSIKAIVGDGMLLTEQQVCYAGALGVAKDEGWGTSDIIAALSTELQVHDYKHGMGVEVDAGEDVIDADTGLVEVHPNPQMGLYGLGALAEVDDSLGPFKTVRLVIHQPRIKSAPSEYVLSVEALRAWGESYARPSVKQQQGAEMMRNSTALKAGEWERIYLNPNEKSCKFCRAKATCSALRDTAALTVFAQAPATPEEFDDVPTKLIEHVKAADSDWLAKVMAKADLIDDWLKAVRAEVECRLLAGQQIDGFKVVTGKRGNRAWRNAEEAETALKAMRLKVEQMYDLKLISPTSAEKLANDEGAPLGPRQWTKLQALITQADGKPHVAPANDKRAALTMTPVADDFDVVSTADEFEALA